MSPVQRAAFVFAFMTFITLQAATGFVYALLGGARPWAVQAIDDLIDRVFVSTLGLPGAVIVLMALGVLFSWLAYRRGIAEQRAA